MSIDLQDRTIFLVSHYSPQIKYRGFTRYHDWGKHLVQQGYQVYLFCSSAMHYSDLNLVDEDCDYKEVVEDGVHYIYVRCPSYKSNGLGRIKNMIVFARKLSKVFQLFPRPEIIINCAPNHLSCVTSIQYGRKHKIPVINDIVDLWPEAIVTYFHMSRSNPIIWALYMGEKWIYKNSTAIIHSGKGFLGYLEERGWEQTIGKEKLFYINMGVNVSVFDRNAETRVYDDHVLTDDKVFKVVYTGSVRLVNDLKMLVDAGKIIKDRGINDIFIMIHGAGDQVEELQKYCRDNNITNVKLYGRVQKDDIPYILTHSDLCVLCYQSTPLLRFGGSMNKMFEYFASGKPVIANAKMGYSTIEEYQCGTELGTNDPEKLADEILRIYCMPKEEREQLGRNARKAAEAYDVNRLNEQLDVAIEYAKGHNFY